MEKLRVFQLLVYFSNVVINILAVILYYTYCQTNYVSAIIFNLLLNFLNLR